MKYTNVVSIDAGGHRAALVQRRDRLVEEYLPLVREIASRLWSSLPDSFLLDDLTGAGQMGLLHAATIFDEARGVPFEAFARMHIRWFIRAATRRKYFDQAVRTVSIDSVEPVGEARAETPDWDERIDVRRLIERVALVVRVMPARQRQLLSLRYSGDGLSVAECAERMGITTASAHNLHRKCITHIHKRFLLASSGTGSGKRALRGH